MYFLSARANARSCIGATIRKLNQTAKRQTSVSSDKPVIHVGRQRHSVVGARRSITFGAHEFVVFEISRSTSQSCRAGAYRRIPLETIRWAVSNTNLGAVGPRGDSRLPKDLA